MRRRCVTPAPLLADPDRRFEARQKAREEREAEMKDNEAIASGENPAALPYESEVGGC